MLPSLPMRTSTHVVHKMSLPRTLLAGPLSGSVAIAVHAATASFTASCREIIVQAPLGPLQGWRRRCLSINILIQLLFDRLRVDTPRPPFCLWPLSVVECHDPPDDVVLPCRHFGAPRRGPLSAGRAVQMNAEALGS